jgi:hypothetical protein
MFGIGVPEVVLFLMVVALVIYLLRRRERLR